MPRIYPTTNSKRSCEYEALEPAASKQQPVDIIEHTRPIAGTCDTSQIVSSVISSFQTRFQANIAQTKSNPRSPTYWASQAQFLMGEQPRSQFGAPAQDAFGKTGFVAQMKLSIERAAKEKNQVHEPGPKKHRLKVISDEDLAFINTIRGADSLLDHRRSRCFAF